jgi:hypothetical protein
MPPLLDNVLHPERRGPQPEAERVDLRLPMLIGMAAWAVALVVAVVLELTGVVNSANTVWITAVGLALGFVGLAWERKNRARYLGE